VIGSGPNGLAAAITLARAGLSVSVLEAEATLGGGARSAALTLPGFVHDLCSAVHPLAVASPFFRTLPLADHDLQWIYPSASLAHPLDSGTAVLLERSVEATSEYFGQDAAAYQHLMQPSVAGWKQLETALLGPLQWPRHPLSFARFGVRALRSARSLARSLFKETAAQALFAGLAAHSTLPLEQLITAAFGLVLGITGYAIGWPFPRGGAQKITDALVSYLHSLGGEVVPHSRVESLDELPRTKIILSNVTPRQLLRIAGARLPTAYRRKLERYRYGVAAYKVDWALAGPIPWTAGGCRRAGTVHLGGTLAEIAEAERAPWRGETAAKPFVLLAQPSLFDASRAPEGKHTAWAYCHVPHGSTIDMVERIEAQIERFAPGFRARVLARHVLPPRELERHNANLSGGILMEVSKISGNSSPGLPATSMPHRPRGFTSVRPLHRPAEGSMGCVAILPPKRHCTRSSRMVPHGCHNSLPRKGQIFGSPNPQSTRWSMSPERIRRLTFISPPYRALSWCTSLSLFFSSLPSLSPFVEKTNSDKNRYNVCGIS
jgi:phytoene dehydrogenase-like protein